MNLYETEALMYDPECRGGEPTAADIFSFSFTRSSHLGQ